MLLKFSWAFEIHLRLSSKLVMVIFWLDDGISCFIVFMGWTQPNKHHYRGASPWWIGFGDCINRPSARTRRKNYNSEIFPQHKINGHATGSDWLEVPTIYKAYIRPIYLRESPHKVWPYIVQHLQFRILEFPLTELSLQKQMVWSIWK